MGMALLAIAEYGWITTRGLSLRLDRPMVQKAARSLLVQQFNTWGPTLTRQLDQALEPSMQQQVSSMLKHLTVSVDGVDFGVPTETQLRLRHRLVKIADHQLNHYIQTEVRPSKIIKLLFSPSLAPHWWVFKMRDHGIWIPVHIYLK